MKLPIYMDYQATTPVDPRVLNEMIPYFSEKFGNAASRTHSFGWEAEEAVDQSRVKIAKLMNADPREIVLTSGATESDNIAIKGAAWMHAGKGNHIITSPTEHNAVIDTCKRLERDNGCEITYVPVDNNGMVDPDDVKKAITDKTILVSIMAANNEVGTIAPVSEIGKVCREKGVLFHCDATQAIGKYPFDVKEMNVDLASLTAHKMYGPKGIGALYVRRSKPRVRVASVIDGGGHERGMRSGTLNVPGIVGFGKACELCILEGEQERERLTYLRDKLYKTISELDYITLNGHPTERLAGNLNLSFAYVEGESLMMGMKEIAVSSGSACTSAQLEPSHVLRAMGVNDDLIHTSIRFGFGRFTTEEEIDYVSGRVVENVNRLRDLSPLYEMAKEGVDLNKVEWTKH